MLKKIITIGTLITLSSIIVACGDSNETKVEQTETQTESISYKYEVTDTEGRLVQLEEKPENAVVIGSSLVDLWQLGDIEIVGTTSDALDKEELGLGEEVTNIGALKEPNIEAIMELEPDIVVMSLDKPANAEILQILDNSGINTLVLDYDNFDSYLECLEIVATISDDENIYIENGQKVEEEINSIIDKASDLEERKMLLLRSSSSTIKPLDSSYFSSEILENLGLINIAGGESSISDTITIEYVLEEDPEYIFIVPMGDGEDAFDGLKSYIDTNVAWEQLSAVENNKIIQLPKDFFLNKPNERWAEAYEFVYNEINE